MRKVDTIYVQIATPNDTSQIESINRTVWLTTYTNPPIGVTEKEIKQMFRHNTETESIIRTLLNDHSHSFLVARCRGKVVGYTHAIKHIKFNEIMSLYILSEYQRQGIGTKIMKKLFLWFGESKPIYIEVVSYNQNALVFYQKHGFSFCGRYSVNDSKWNVLPSGKRLPVEYLCKFK